MVGRKGEKKERHTYILRLFKVGFLTRSEKGLDIETKTAHEMEKKFQAEEIFSSVAQSCPAVCDPMNCSTPGLPVHLQIPESTQTHVH